MRNDMILTIKTAKKKRMIRYVFTNAILFFVVLGLCFAMLMLGDKIYGVKEVFTAIFNDSLKGAGFAVKYVRLPRLTVCLFAGIAFGISGNTFQTIFRNPLANPNVVGVTSGASAAAVFCILVLQASQTVTYIASIIGGLMAVAIIFLLTMRKSYSPARMILVGIGLQVMLNSLISYMLLIGAETDIPQTLRWLSGSTNSVALKSSYPLMICVAIILPIIFMNEKNLNIMQLGEQTAIALGVKTSRTRFILLICSVCLIAFATATTGPIAFISFLAGPIARRLVGNDKVGTLASGFMGAILVLGADLIGQFAFTLKYPVGVITGILGAPYLIFLIVKMHRKGVL